MPSTNKTATLGLNQWIKTDGVCMADFNADNEKVDAAIAEAKASGVKFFTGTYTGDGEKGASHPNTLTLPFAPRLLLIYRANNDCPPSLLIAGAAKATAYYQYTRGGGVDVTFSGNTVSWYHNGHYFDESNQSMTISPSQDIQLNASGIIYSYLAIG